jgi:hypothetical protein
LRAEPLGPLVVAVSKIDATTVRILLLNCREAENTAVADADGRTRRIFGSFSEVRCLCTCSAFKERLGNFQTNLELNSQKTFSDVRSD